MADHDCVSFLQWALPRMGRRWAGYRKVRRHVCRRVLHRMNELELDSFTDYRRFLEINPSEWLRLDEMTNITISRFYRERAVYDYIRDELLPALVDQAREAGRSTVKVWSAGCASGEEPYTLKIMWELVMAPVVSDIGFEILATDVRPVVLQRAEQARYMPSAMKDLPATWRETAFGPVDHELLLLPRFRDGVNFAQHDIRSSPPRGLFDLVMCRYVAFTYFDEAGQLDTLKDFAQVTRPGAALVIGSSENLPPGESAFRKRAPRLRVFERSMDGTF